MIIDALIEVAHRENLDHTLGLPGTTKHIALRLNKDGNIHKIEYKEDFPVRLPWAFSRTNGIRPNLLTESVKRLTQPKDRKASADFHARFAAKCPPGQPAAEAVKNFFNHEMPPLAPPKGFEEVSVVFYYKDDERPIAEIPELYDAIAESLREEFKTVDHASQYDEGPQCILDVHMKLKLPGLKNPQSLIGCDKNTAQIGGYSHEERMRHAAMSYEVMRDYSTGLVWLAQNRVLPIAPTKGETLSYLGWAKTPHPFEGHLQCFLRGSLSSPTKTDKKTDSKFDPEKWIAYLHGVLDDPDLLADKTPFYFLSFSCKNKIAVRGFQISTVGEMAQRFRRFFEDFSLKTQDGGTQWTVITPRRILNQVLPPGGDPKKASFSMGLVEAFYDALFTGAKYPHVLLQAALGIYEDSVVTSAISTQSQSFQAPVVTQCTINAFMRQELNMTNPGNNLFYVLGQLFGVYETRNFWAKDREETNATTRQFKAFVRSPGRVLEALKMRSEHHTLKLEARHWPGAHVKRERELWQQLGEILGDSGIPLRAFSPQDRNWIIRGREEERAYLISEYKKQKAAREAEKAEKAEMKAERVEKTKKQTLAKTG